MERALSDRELARCHGLGSAASQLEFLANEGNQRRLAAAIARAVPDLA